jgi:flagellar M-ring protein FliF
MDFLNKAYGQVTDLFQSMTPSARLTTGLLVAAIGISMLFLFQQQTESANEILFGGETLTSQEIGVMEAAFAQADLNGWDSKGNQMRVPRGKRHTYLAALAENNALPQESGAAFEKVLSDQSPFENRKMGELRAKVALQKELAFTIRELNGIESATVQIQEITGKDAIVPRPMRRAAVTVKTTGNTGIDSNQERMIRDVVAYGGGIDRADVVIADTNGGRVYNGPPKDGTLSGEHNVYADTQRRFEEQIRRKIVARLSNYPNLNISVYVELNQMLEDRTTKISYDEKPTALSTRTTSIEENSSTSANAGRPGAGPNGVGNQAVAVNGGGSDQESTLTESVEEQENTAGVTQTITRRPGLVPNHVTVSIGVPKSHFRRVWLQQNPPVDGENPVLPTAADLEAVQAQVVSEIESSVVPLIPKAPAGEDTFPRVKVIPFTDLPLAEPAVPTLTDNAGAWFAAHWQTLAMLGVALFGVMFLRGMIRSAQASAAAALAADSEAAKRMAELNMTDDEEEDDNELGNSLRGRHDSTGRSLRDELTELVRDDPNAAASVLQNWIKEAAA